MSLETRAAVYAAIKAKNMTCNEVAKELHLHKDTARQYIAELRRCGKLWIVKKTKQGYVMTAVKPKEAYSTYRPPVADRNKEADAMAPLWRGTAWQGLEAFV